MHLNRSSAYAIKALVVMAQGSAKNNLPAVSHVIAQERGIPERFLLKVLIPLVHAGLLQSVKGPHGGYRLTRPAAKITLLEIIEGVEGSIRGEAPAVRVDQPPSALDKQLQAVCDQAAAELRKQLEKVTLADLAKKK
jgi:Rrf2 family protein